MPIRQIQKLINVNRPTIYNCIDIALAADIDARLKDLYHRPFGHKPTWQDSRYSGYLRIAQGTAEMPFPRSNLIKHPEDLYDLWVPSPRDQIFLPHKGKAHTMFCEHADIG